MTRDFRPLFFAQNTVPGNLMNMLTGFRKLIGFRKYCLNSKRGQTFLDTVTARPTGNLETATELKLLI